MKLNSRQFKAIQALIKAGRGISNDILRVLGGKAIYPDEDLPISKRDCKLSKKKRTKACKNCICDLRPK